MGLLIKVVHRFFLLVQPRSLTRSRETKENVCGNFVPWVLL